MIPGDKQAMLRMTAMSWSRVSRSIDISAWLSIAGCATFQVRPQDVDVPVWSLGKLPGTIGVHYTKELQSHVLYEGDEFLLGQSTVELVDYQLERMFATRITIADLPTVTSPAPEVDAILVIDIGAAVFWFGHCSPRNPDVLKVAYEVRLLSRSGENLSSWRTIGYGAHVCEKLDVRWPRAQAAMRLALQNAVRNLSDQLLPLFEGGFPAGSSR